MMSRLVREFRVRKTVLHLWFRGVKFGPRPVTNYRLPVIQNQGLFVLGDHARFFGEEARALIRVLPGARLTIGNRVLINSGASILCHESVSIGDDVLIGNFVAIADTGSHEVTPEEGVQRAPVVIEDNVWIGRGVFIMPGTRIGRGSVIGAGSIVTSDIPTNSVSVGSPARVIRYLPESVAPRR